MAEAKIEELNKEEVKTEESKEECAAESNDGYTLEFRSVDNNAKRITKNEAGKCIWKEVSPLAGKTFVIKPYQRGYRWGTENVRKLLEDIWKYSTQLLSGSGYGTMFSDMENGDVSNADKFDFYCLQTLTVEKENEERYELIDGQQRLTTLWLIYYMLILFTCGSDEIPYPPYGIVYERNEAKDSETITITQALAKNIPDKVNEVSARNKNKPSGWYDEYKDAIRTRLDPIKDDIKKGTGGALSIDLVYIENAIYTIIDFIKDAYNVGSTNVGNMFEVIQRNLFFIWYEVNTDADPYTTFTNINSNQIRLTDAELIKSLVLRKDETISGGDKKTPTDYAKIWEEIEQGLSKDELWAYISNDQTKATRIDLILTLYASKNGYSGTGSLFDWYEQHKEDCKERFAESVMDSKNGLPSIYYRILEWYDNVDIFHLIGLLTKFRELGLKPFGADKKEQEKLIIEIFNNYDDDKCCGQEDFIKALKDEVKNCLEGRRNPVDKKKKDGEKYPLIDSVSYEDDKVGVEAVLWTLNVWETMEASENNVGEGEKRRRTPIVNSRFPFSKIAKGTKWQIEHIFPQNPKDISNAKDIFKDVDEAEKKYEELCDGLKLNCIKDIDRIQNLAMLTASVNDSISNGTLEEKRKKLVKKIGEGSFVPCATVNAFLLYYSQTVKTEASDYQYWTKLDAECYEARIVDCLKSFGIK